MKSRVQRSITLGVRVLLGLALLAATQVTLAQDDNGGLPPGVIARQGGEQVSLQDFDAYAQKIPEADRVGFFDSPKRIESVIMDLLLDKQLAAEAKKQKLDEDPGVQRQIQLATESALARIELDHFRASLTLPDFAKLAKEYYLGHKSEFLTHGSITVRHVLVSTKERGDADAKARIAEVEAAAHKNPDQFETLVEQYSDDPSKKQNHGVIGDAGSASMAAAFASAASALTKPGQLSPVVKTQFGYHVLQLVERAPDRQDSFEEVREGLTRKMRAEYISNAVATHAAQFRGNPLEANPDLVASLRSRFLPAGEQLPSEAATAANEAARKAAADKQTAPAH